MKDTPYIAKQADKEGYVSYSDDEQAIWKELFERQIQIVQNRGCDEYLEGIDKLGLKADHIPQVPEVNKNLSKVTGWEIAPVSALINFDKFFELLSNKQFPAATFIRTRQEMEYLQEPDIFHEVFGHCPLLTVPAYANFMHEYGKLGLKAEHKDRVMLARLYWFTVEFGLIQTAKGLRIYGGGILSSIGETVYALESNIPVRKPLDPLDAFRTPYRIDIFQPIYFMIQSFDQLFNLSKLDLLDLIQQARKLGMHPPSFPPKDKK